jgi:hypothetical protein
MIQVHVQKGDSKNDINLHIKSQISIDNNTITYIAANPPTFMTSFSGSGLPYPNENQAYDNTPNRGQLVLDNNNEGILMLYSPNSYYTDLGNTLVKPHILLEYEIQSNKKTITVKVSDGIPYRSLTHPYNRESSIFYGTSWNLPVRSQESILLSSSFPDKDVHYDNFWGLRPPN